CLRPAEATTRGCASFSTWSGFRGRFVSWLSGAATSASRASGTNGVWTQAEASTVHGAPRVRRAAVARRAAALLARRGGFRRLRPARDLDPDRELDRACGPARADRRESHASD